MQSHKTFRLILKPKKQGLVPKQCGPYHEYGCFLTFVPARTFGWGGEAGVGLWVSL
jgi:hypothetical protein